VYRARVSALERQAGVEAVALFRNEGAGAGATQTHPHTQILALPFVPGRIDRELRFAAQYLDTHGQCPTCRLIHGESLTRGLSIAESRAFVAMAAFAGRAAYETWIVPKTHACHFSTMSDMDVGDLAHLLAKVLPALGIATGEAPFNLVLQAGSVGTDANHARGLHWRLELIPRLTVPSGFELGFDTFIVTVPPERAAQVIRTAVGVSTMRQVVKGTVA